MQDRSRCFTAGWLFPCVLLWLLVPMYAAAQQGIPIAGRVLDAQGAPFAGATVTLAVEASEHEAVKLVLAGRTRPEPVVTVSSDEGGWFAMEAPDAGLWRVTVEARGHVSMRKKLLPLVDVAVLPALQLTPAGSHTVTVEDAAGKAVAGAQVWAAGDRRWFASRRDGWSPTGRFALTDEQGNATLAQAEDEALQVYAFAAGFAVPETRRSKASASKVVLEKGVSFYVLFQDPQGKPLEGATMRLGSGGAAAGVLGEEGRFTLSLLADRALPFDVSTPAGQQQGGTFSLSAEALKEIESGEPQIMRLPEPIVVEGRVVEDGTRTPVPGALVWNPREARFAVRTDRRGNYRMTLREASRIELRTVAVGYAESGSEVLAEGPGRTDAPTLVLRPAGSVVGRVVDGEGKPVAGASVQVQPDGDGSYVDYRLSIQQRTRSVSLPDGRFYFATLPPKLDWQVVVRAQGFAEARRAVQSGAEVEIVMAAPRKARGVVVDADGTPIAGAQVLMIAVPTASDPLSMGHFDNELWMQDAASFPHSESGQQGQFEITGLASGMAVLGARAEGYAPVVREPVYIEDVPVTDLGKVRLRPAVTIAGQVVDQDEQPIEGARIHWNVGHYGAAGGMRMNELLYDSERRQQTDAGGRFEIGPLEAGVAVDISASAQGFVNQQAPGVVAPREEAVRIVMTRGATIAGVVVDRRGSPVSRAMVSVGRIGQGARFGMTRSQQSERADAEGVFEISNLAAGTVYVQAQSRAHGSARIDGIELGPGDRREDLRLVLDARVTLRGQITDSQGRMVEGAAVFAFEGRGADPVARRASDRSDGDGRYRLLFEGPGTFQVSVQHADLLRVEESLELAAGEHRHDFVLQSGHAIRGQVIDGDDMPVAGARVTLAGSGQHYIEPRGVRTDEAGRFLIEGVDDGAYSVDAGVADWAQAHVDSLILEGEDINGVVLRLTRGAVVRGRIVGLDEGDREHVRVELMRVGAFGLRPGQVEPASAAYRFDHVGPGAWQVMARLPSGRMVSERIEVNEQDQETLLDLVFEAGWTVTGLATVNGEPLVGASITASSANGSAGSTRTDREGRYRLEELSSGQVFFNLISADNALVEMRSIVLDADTEVAFAIETSPIVGRVVAADGLPLSGAVVMLLAERQGSYFGVSGTAITRADGSFLLTATEAGAKKLRIELQGYAPVEHALEIVRGVEIGALAIVLQRAEVPETE